MAGAHRTNPGRTIVAAAANDEVRIPSDTPCNFQLFRMWFIDMLHLRKTS